jgi:hypothetical protein
MRAAPALFEDLNITFKTSTFTKPARLAALDRMGFYVKTLNFNLLHSKETFLPPLVEPDTGAELSFTYTPQIQPPSPRRPKYGDAGTNEILTRQYPALFHAATNVPAFIQAFSSFVNLEHLKVSCPGYHASQRHRRSTVDYALISLRIAVEQNSLNALTRLTLAPIHLGGLMYLAPVIGYGASPRSASRWSCIQHLTIHSSTLPSAATTAEPDHMKLLQSYIRNFQRNLSSLIFRWDGDKGPMPIQQPVMSETVQGQHPAHRNEAGALQQPPTRHRGSPAPHFPKLRQLEIENVACSAMEVSAFVACHKRTLEELNFEDTTLTNGTWDEALAPLTRQARRVRHQETADIPIMLSPTSASPFSAPMERIDVTNEGTRRRSLRLSRWLYGRRSKPVSARKVREGLLGCEEQLKKVLGGVLPWK